MLYLVLECRDLVDLDMPPECVCNFSRRELYALDHSFMTAPILVALSTKS